jgi:hypothetical protein
MLHLPLVYSFLCFSFASTCVGVVTMENGIAMEKGKFPDLKVDVSDPAVVASLIPVLYT